ncbi:hypothetical protein AWU65_30330 [Paenibacillus glucanolyticus]|uniref:Uncharacterized protein n=2 Tax=Paenibacillus TaxID=44249 RepID=A0A163FFW8_9BACL|nr:hypothetical protein AWU65_30330 [Paenibacillus glucanolyticus]
MQDITGFDTGLLNMKYPPISYKGKGRFTMFQMTHRLFSTQTFENMSYILSQRLLQGGISADPSKGVISSADIG